jgi:hypothetical protein
MKIIVLALLFCTAFACREIPNSIPADIEFEAAPIVRYTQGDIRKIRWIEGSWKSTQPEQPVKKNFQFSPDNSLDILEIGNSGAFSTLLTWHAGCFYLGDNREWVVTWIGEKDVRFEPTRPGKNPFTWTRFGEDQWYHVTHSPRGDQPVLMQRIGELQP